jgi:hypothetical protein
MARTSASEVAARFDTELSDPDLRPFIDDANALVTQRLGDESLDSALLTTIETYVACHFAAVRDPRFTDVSGAARDASYEDRGSPGGSEGLQRTAHGRRALSLDPTGELAAGGDTFTLGC